MLICVRVKAHRTGFTVVARKLCHTLHPQRDHRSHPFLEDLLRDLLRALGAPDSLLRQARHSPCPSRSRRATVRTRVSASPRTYATRNASPVACVSTPSALACNGCRKGGGCTDRTQSQTARTARPVRDNKSGRSPAPLAGTWRLEWRQERVAPTVGPDRYL